MTTKFHDYRGVIHLHSINSYDGTTPVKEILEAADKNEIDFVMLTDHSNLEAKTMEGWQARVLFIVGQEISPRFNHYIAFGCNNPIVVGEESDEKPQAYIDEVVRQGGIGFIAHPDHGGTKMFHVKHYPWTEWQVSGYVGMGIWDFMTDWQSSLDRVPGAVLNYLFPAYVLRGPRKKTLKRWDELNRGRKIVGIGELDNHNTLYKILGRQLHIFPFEKAFKLIGTHILTEEPLESNNNAAINTVLQALRMGRAYVSLEYFRTARGFSFVVSDEGNSAIMGDDFVLRKEAVLRVTAPGRSVIRIIKDGRTFHSGTGCELYMGISEVGIYRAEVYLKTWRKSRPWIFSNPIYVRSEEGF